MVHGDSQLLHYIYQQPEQIYLRSLERAAPNAAAHRGIASFVFGHNPRTRDYTHVGAAEMLAGLSQAAYCMVARYRPKLLVADLIARVYFSAVDVTFSKMLAPETDASLAIEMTLMPNGLPRFDFDGFIRGYVECGLSEYERDISLPLQSAAELRPSVERTLRTFYNNGSLVTLKSLEAQATGCWRSRSSFELDTRLRLCRYTTTTQLIIGLSQIAFAIVGEANAAGVHSLGWENQDFLDSMGDQALVKLSYQRPRSSAYSIELDSTIAASKTLRGCKFIRLALNGELQGTMDSMLSPRVPVKTLRRGGEGAASA